MQAGSSTPKPRIRGYAIPPVPSFRGGRLDTPADAMGRHESKMLPSPQRLKVQAAVEKAQQIQQRILAASNEKIEKANEVEAILAGKSTLPIAEQEARVRDATQGSVGVDYRRRAQAWTYLAKLAQQQNCPERAISYLQEALIHKAQPKQAIEESLRDLYVQNGGSLSDLLSPPDDDLSGDDSLEANRISTPITKRLQEKLKEHDRRDELKVTSLQFGTPRADKISLLKTQPAAPYVEQETPSPTPAPISHLSEILERAYIEEPPIDFQAKKENIPIKNPFDVASFASPVPVKKPSMPQSETPNSARRVRRSLRLARRLNY